MWCRLLAGSQVGQHQLEQPTHVAATARDERLRHERRLALAERIDDGHGSGLTRTDGILLRLVAGGLTQTQRLLGLALEAAVGDLLAEVLRHPAVVAGRDVLDRLEQHEQHDQCDDADDDGYR